MGVVVLLAAGSLAAVTAAPEAPLLHGPIAAGGGTRVAGPAVAPTPKTIDGDIADWAGVAPGYAGATVYSHGELIYQDHLFDAFGPDNGKDASRAEKLDALAAVAPDTYRIEPLFQADAPGEFGVPAPEEASASEVYGDAGRQDASDLLEVRVADAGPGTGAIALLARTTTLTAADSTALLVLADTGPGGLGPIPFNSKLNSATADVAILLKPGGTGLVLDRAHPTPMPVPAGVDVAINPAGWTNAIEAAIPRSLLQRPDGTLKLAVAAGPFDPNGPPDLTGAPTPQLKSLGVGGTTANLANVAFRGNEPVRVFYDKLQALSLYAGSIEPFFTTIDTAKLAAGATETYVPGPGYHERLFTSGANISAEQGQDGIVQPYGVYIPTTYQPGTPTPAAVWLHWRGGNTSAAATVTPRTMRDNGESRGALVFAPRGRGTSTWYLGKGHQDFLEVWDDAMRTFSVDADRVYVTGHSMGGFGSYLLATLYPDRFAGSFPVEGPVTQGAFTGADFEGCDEYTFEEYSFCYVQTNNGNARATHTLKLLDNLRHVPIAIYQGTIDELVPQSGTAVQVKRLHDLSYRYRYFQFPTYEHYSHPIVDEWMAGVDYLRDAKRVANPARVTYVRDMPFERVVETGTDQRPETLAKVTPLPFDFDRAYWMSGLEPADAVKGQARFDGTTFGIPEPARLVVPEAPTGPASLGQAGPYITSGQQWLANPVAPTPAVENRFDVTLSGAKAVTLDLARMGLKLDGVDGRFSTDGPVLVRLARPDGTTCDLDVPEGEVTVKVFGDCTGFLIGVRIEASASPIPTPPTTIAARR